MAIKDVWESEKAGFSANFLIEIPYYATSFVESMAGQYTRDQAFVCSSPEKNTY